MKLEQAFDNVLQITKCRPRVVERLALARAHGRVLAHAPAASGEAGGSASSLIAGTPLTPLRVAQLAAAGHASVEVIRRPTVAVFTVGEAAEPGMPDVEGVGFDHARDLLVGLLRADGYEPTAWPRLPSDPRQVEIALRDAGCAFDSIFVCGGSRALAEVEHVLARFGRPQFASVECGSIRCDAVFGVLDEACLLGLPDDPVVLAGMYLTLGRALLDGLHGRSEVRQALHGVLVDTPVAAAFQFARMEPMPTGQLRVRPLAGDLRIAAGLPLHANAVLVPPDGRDDFREGKAAWVIPLPGT